MNKRKAVYALGTLIFAGAALLLFIIAANEQSVLARGSPAPDEVRLQDLGARRLEHNKHIELSNFYFGKQYIYTAKLVQFRDVYVPVFAKGQPEEGSHLQVLVWIRNDRNSNQPLIESEQQLQQLVADMDRNSRTITGVLVKPEDRVRTLTLDAYPGTNAAALQVLWARNFPEQGDIDILWGIVALCLIAAAGCAVAYKRTPRITQSPAFQERNR